MNKNQLNYSVTNDGIVVNAKILIETDKSLLLQKNINNNDYVFTLKKINLPKSLVLSIVFDDVIEDDKIKFSIKYQGENNEVEIKDDEVTVSKLSNV